MRGSQSPLGWVQVFAFVVVASLLAAQTNPVPSPRLVHETPGYLVHPDHAQTLNIQMTYQSRFERHQVTEQFGRELSVFAMDGTALTMTHYCNIGNEPRLRLKPQDAQDVCEFDLLKVISSTT
jgi:hypothetical protein